jgi:cation transport regulator ChaC
MADEWTIVKDVGTDEEASVIVGFLENSGIPAEVDSLQSSEFPLGDNVDSVRVRVPAERAEEAIALLNTREDVVTGEDGALAGAPVDEEEGSGQP